MLQTIYNLQSTVLLTIESTINYAPHQCCSCHAARQDGVLLGRSNCQQSPAGPVNMRCSRTLVAYTLGRQSKLWVKIGAVYNGSCKLQSCQKQKINYNTALHHIRRSTLSPADRACTATLATGPPSGFPSVRRPCRWAELTCCDAPASYDRVHRSVGDRARSWIFRRPTGSFHSDRPADVPTIGRYKARQIKKFKTKMIK